MNVSEGKSVTVHYVLKLDNGRVYESTLEEDPLVYTHGLGEIIKGMEKELTGMSIGEQKTFIVEPDEGYGPAHEPHHHGAAGDGGHLVTELAQQQQGHAAYSAGSTGNHNRSITRLEAEKTAAETVQLGPDQPLDAIRGTIVADVEQRHGAGAGFVL